MSEITLKVFLPIYLLSWFALAFAWRSYLVWKRTGRNPYRLGKTDSAHDFVGVLFRLLKSQLVSEGVFKISRNPIFLGMRINLLGLFLILPNAVTLTVLVLGDTLMQIQVRLEEEYLTRTHGQNYEQYRRQTRRWI